MAKAHRLADPFNRNRINISIVSSIPVVSAQELFDGGTRYGGIVRDVVDSSHEVSAFAEFDARSVDDGGPRITCHRCAE